MTEETAPTGAFTGIAPAITAHTVSNAAPAAADAIGDGVGVRATIRARCGANSAINPMGPTTETTTALMPVAAISRRARWRAMFTPRVVAEESSWASSGNSLAHQIPIARNGVNAATRGEDDLHVHKSSRSREPSLRLRSAQDLGAAH